MPREVNHVGNIGLATEVRAAALLQGLHDITLARSAHDVAHAVQRFATEHGFVSFAIGRDIDGQQWVGDPEIYTWPSSLVNGYIRLRRIESDKGIAALRDGSPLYSWKKRSVSQSAAEEKMLHLLDEAGIGGGILVGIRGGVSRCSVLSLSMRTPRRLSSTLVDACRLIGDAALLRLTVQAPMPAPGASLPARQIEILRWVARGKSNRDIAVILRLTERNVVYHLSSAMTAIGVHSRSQAVAWLAQHHPHFLDNEHDASC
jgi:DNA-binding CsgD family transcriptional regulator